MQIMGMDPLRDTGLIYESMLKEAGTRIKVDIFQGLPHGAPDFFPMHSSAKQAIEDLRVGVQWIMQQQDQVV